MKRWIIRSFFIGLLLLFVGGWILSYKWSWDLSHQGYNFWSVGCVWGTCEINWWGHVQFRPSGFKLDNLSPATDYLPYYRHHLLGFHLTTELDAIFLAIPFYFPTTICAALLWLAWRKTRPKPEGRAFPVELTK